MREVFCKIFAFVLCVFVYMCFLKHLENKFLTMGYYLKNECLRNTIWGEICVFSFKIVQVHVALLNSIS